MSEDRDEPLEGDIGPAAGVGASRSAETAGAERARVAEELRRYEAEREERRRRTNAVSGRVAVAVAALFLAFLTYDSVRTAVAARSRGDDWVYPPAVVAGVCGVALLTLVTWAWRRVK
ncbi:hypothetical protein E1281_31430 [Actinomadura sp. KC345]|uniref:hypothetical protein n=1 Tax=Actinomadura sp. KC345 TaxID=2530371 RepID=UPI001052C8B1|nr:hypothetical protein [Actinomadura sp. KC345]TDC45116.1 hypothetical protein E1281_31430 [Actinomadura sp. KC345]